MTAFRPAITNWRTTEPDVDLVADVVRELGPTVAGSSSSSRAPRPRRGPTAPRPRPVDPRRRRRPAPADRAGRRVPARFWPNLLGGREAPTLQLRLDDRCAAQPGAGLLDQLGVDLGRRTVPPVQRPLRAGVERHGRNGGDALGLVVPDEAERRVGVLHAAGRRDGGGSVEHREQRQRAVVVGAAQVLRKLDAAVVLAAHHRRHRAPAGPAHHRLRPHARAARGARPSRRHPRAGRRAGRRRDVQLHRRQRGQGRLRRSGRDVPRPPGLVARAVGPAAGRGPRRADRAGPPVAGRRGRRRVPAQAVALRHPQASLARPVLGRPGRRPGPWCWPAMPSPVRGSRARRCRASPRPRRSRGARETQRRSARARGPRRPPGRHRVRSSASW